jgi:hypothetical protein
MGRHSLMIKVGLYGLHWTLVTHGNEIWQFHNLFTYPFNSTYNLKDPIGCHYYIYIPSLLQQLNTK